MRKAQFWYKNQVSFNPPSFLTNPRLRRLEPAARAVARVSRQRDAFAALWCPLQRGRNQLAVLPAAPERHLCALGGQRAKAFPLLGQAAQGHLAPAAPGQLHRAARRLSGAGPSAWSICACTARRAGTARPVIAPYSMRWSPGCSLRQRPMPMLGASLTIPPKSPQLKTPCTPSKDWPGAEPAGRTEKKDC